MLSMFITLQCKNKKDIKSKTDGKLFETKEIVNKEVKNLDLKTTDSNTSDLIKYKVSMFSQDNKAFRRDLRSFLYNEIQKHLEKNISITETISSESTKILLRNTDWIIVSGKQPEVQTKVFDVAWFKYARRDTNDMTKFLDEHQNHYDLDKVLNKDLPTPILKVLTKKIFADWKSAHSSDDKNNSQELIVPVMKNTFDGVIRILVNKFSEYGNKVLSATDVESVNLSHNGQMPLFDFLVVKSKKEPYKEMFGLLAQTSSLYNIEEQGLLTSYDGFVNSLAKSDKFQIVKMKATVSPSLIAILQVYKEIMKKFDALMEDSEVRQKNHGVYQKVSDENNNKMKALIRISFVRKLRTVIIFHLIKHMQRKKENF